MNPVNWWHNLEGGKIAEQRPPPPGSEDAYPNLSTVPARPTPPDREALKAISTGLIADRVRAEHEAESAPLPDPSLPSASPALFGSGTMPPPPPAGASATGAVASASLPAASAQPASPSANPPAPATSPAPATPPTPAPRAAVASAPLAAPPPEAAGAGTPTGAAGGSSAQQPTQASGGPAAPGQEFAAANPAAAQASSASVAQPALPNQPPPRPELPGLAGSGTAATSSAPKQADLPADTVPVAFPAGSAALPADAASALKQLVAKRGGATIAVTGYGEAGSNDPSAQQAALTLGLSRAQAVAEALTAQGVPAGAVRVGAQASGRGASLRLIQ